MGRHVAAKIVLARILALLPLIVLHGIQLVAKGRMSAPGLACRLQLGQALIRVPILTGRIMLRLRQRGRFVLAVVQPALVVPVQLIPALVMLIGGIAIVLRRMGALSGTLRTEKRRVLSRRRKRLVAAAGILRIVVRRKLGLGFRCGGVLGVIRRALVITIGRRLRRECRPVIRMRRIFSGLIRLRSALPILGLATPASHRTIRP